MTIDEIAVSAGALELQATYGGEHDSEPWGVTITTYSHGIAHDPGSETGSGRGEGRTFADAVTLAAAAYKPNSQPLPQP